MSVIINQKNPNYMEEQCPYCKATKLVRIEDEIQCMSCGEAWTAAGPILSCKNGVCSLRG